MKKKNRKMNFKKSRILYVAIVVIVIYFVTKYCCIKHKQPTRPVSGPIHKIFRYKVPPVFNPTIEINKEKSIFDYLTKVNVTVATNRYRIQPKNFRAGLMPDLYEGSQSSAGMGMSSQNLPFNDRTFEPTNSDFEENQATDSIYESIINIMQPYRSEIKEIKYRFPVAPRNSSTTAMDESNSTNIEENVDMEEEETTFESVQQLPINDTKVLKFIRLNYMWPPPRLRRFKKPRMTTSPVLSLKSTVYGSTTQATKLRLQTYLQSKSKSKLTQKRKSEGDGLGPLTTTNKPKVPVIRLPHEYVIHNILKLKEGGRFVETNANDGKVESDTLTLERDYGWTGLLIESDPLPFKYLKRSYRKSWIANVCVSTSSEVKKIRLSTYFKNWRRFRSYDVRSHCFPLYSLIAAAFSDLTAVSEGPIAGTSDDLSNNSSGTITIDYLSLNLEGLAMHFQILKTIPFELINIRAISMAMDSYLMPSPTLLPSSLKSTSISKFSPFDLKAPSKVQNEENWKGLNQLMKNNGYHLQTILQGDVHNYAIYAHTTLNSTVTSSH